MPHPQAMWSGNVALSLHFRVVLQQRASTGPDRDHITLHSQSARESQSEKEDLAVSCLEHLIETIGPTDAQNAPCGDILVQLTIQQALRRRLRH